MTTARFHERVVTVVESVSREPERISRREFILKREPERRVELLAISPERVKISPKF